MGTYYIKKGFTLVELLVTIAIVSIVFIGLMTTMHFTLKVISETKVKASATALANERMEYIRSLPYDSVGTIAGIPNGFIPQRSTTTLNGFIFHERVLIQYVDAPEDGLGALDINGILADYKQVKVEYSWWGSSGTSTIFLLTNIVPPGIETTTGGGTLTVNVFDAAVTPVSGAEVRLYNNTGTSTIDTIRYTNINGVAMFAGTPAGANYELTVTKPGYSTDQTYSATSSNPNPITSHVAVLESAVSTMNFQIDRLSNVLVRTVGPATTDSYTDTFTTAGGSDDASGIFLSTDAQVWGGSIRLVAQGGGIYSSNGSAFSIPVIPAVVDSWDVAAWNRKLIGSSTTVSVQVYGITGTSTYTLIPDVDLPGNSTGFTTSPITLSSLSAATYTGLALRANLSTTDPFVTPELEDWQITYIISEPSISNIQFSLTGNKLIGTTVSSTPVYKHQSTHTTDGSGRVQINNLEWDLYTPLLNTVAYDISQICPNVPYVLAPGVSETMTMTLVPNAQYSLRISIVDTNQNPIIGAQVALSRGGFNISGIASTCGQVFFNSGLVSASDYEVTVSAVGYTSQTIPAVVIDGDESLVVTLVIS